MTDTLPHYDYTESDALYGPTVTAEERADHVIGVLLSDPDAARRYHTIRAVQRRFPEQAALCLLQLKAESGSLTAAADAVGITAQAAAAAIKRAARPDLDSDPAAQYGELLGVTYAIAAAHGEESRPLSQWYRLVSAATTTPTAWPKLRRAAESWLRGLPGPRAAALRADLDTAAGACAEWVAAHPRGSLNLGEQARVSHGLARRRHAYREAAQ